jgi:hypothetical protein
MTSEDAVCVHAVFRKTRVSFDPMIVHKTMPINMNFRKWMIAKITMNTLIWLGQSALSWLAKPPKRIATGNRNPIAIDVHTSFRKFLVSWGTNRKPWPYSSHCRAGAPYLSQVKDDSEPRNQEHDADNNDN